MNRRNLMTGFMTGAALALAGESFGQTTMQVPKQPNVNAIAEQNVKQLLLLMDTDKNGKISKKEWMDFMSKEFDRLDTDQSGELDPKELMQSRVAMQHVPPAVLGK